MAELIEKVPMWVQAIALGLTGLVLVATAVAQLTPSKKDDQFVSKAKKSIG